jgi:hypothetical protein
VRWTKVSSATKYIVEHKLTSSSVWTNSAELGDVSTFTITGLTASTSYYVAVIAINNDGSSPKSSSIRVTTTAVVLTNQVRVLTSTQKSNNHISIIWTKLAGATSYFVLYKLATDTAYTSSGDLGDISTYTLSNLLESTSYHFSVTAKNSAGYSPKSNDVSITTYATPATPTGLAESFKTDTTITINWTRVLGHTYKVYHKL